MFSWILERMRGLGEGYRRVYGSFCGLHPHLRPWHFQWHAQRELQGALESELPRLVGSLLDVGCGLKPYKGLLKPSVQYVGADIGGVDGLDACLVPGEPFPFPDKSFDNVLCSQVVEHVRDLPQFIAEVHRVLKPGGVLLLSVPFVFQVHDKPHDYRRLSEYGVVEELRGFDVDFVCRQGAAGSTLAILFLNWLDMQLAVNYPMFIFKAVLLPVWIPFCLAVNLGAWVMDRLDTTHVFYHNLFVRVYKS